MIVIGDECKHCGAIPIPTEVACDKCGAKQKMEDFVGIVVHFDHDNGNGEDFNEEVFLEEEFHFCGLKCLSDYIADPECAKMDTYSEDPVYIHCNTNDTSTIFYALGRGDLLW